MIKLQPGARLGPYEIIKLLGAGGMGRVYRARDTRLRRDVALKILHRRYQPIRRDGNASSTKLEPPAR